MTDASHITLLPQLLAHVRAAAPKVRLDAARIDGYTAQALETGEADLALGYIPWLESGIYQQTLFPQDWVCLANPRHPRIRKAMTLEAYKREAHVEIVGGTGGKLLEDALRAHRIQRQIALQLPGFLGLYAIVSTTAITFAISSNRPSAVARAAIALSSDCPATRSMT